MQKKLIIYILGTTGVGKTKLSLEVAKKFNGEIVSCDSKQLYKYADIMTAKATLQEQKVAPHHLLDCLQLQEQSYYRNKYFQKASSAINSIWNRNKIPIVTGGTNYYIQTLLFNLKIDEEKQVEQTPEIKKKLDQIKEISNQEKYKMLQQIDPLIANRLHPHDEARITSYLERCMKNGGLPSQQYRLQTHQLRNSQTVIFWLRNSDKQEHLRTISKRIKQMLSDEGIIQILSVFYYLKNNDKQVNIQQLKGISQSIGYKQFLSIFQDFLDHVKKNEAKIYQELEQIKNYACLYEKIKQFYSSWPEKYTLEKQILDKCSQKLILNTKHYCKRQITWLRNRIFVKQGKHFDKFFVLELNEGKGGLMERFQTEVQDKAFKILETIQEKGFGILLENQKHFSSAQNKQLALKQWKVYKCQQCEQIYRGKYEWGIHLKSRKHAKRVKCIEQRKHRQNQGLNNGQKIQKEQKKQDQLLNKEQ